MLQNYNKILTKVLYSQLYQNKTQIKTSTKKNPHILRTPIFSAAKIEKKSAQITRANTVYMKLEEELSETKGWFEDSIPVSTK